MRIPLQRTLISLLCILATPAFAAGKAAPSGAEIAQKARSAVLDSALSGTGEKNGKKIKFTPAKFDLAKTDAELEEGHFLGVLETEARG